MIPQISYTKDPAAGGQSTSPPASDRADASDRPKAFAAALRKFLEQSIEMDRQTSVRGDGDQAAVTNGFSVD